MTSLDIILPAYNPLPGWEDIVIGRFQSLVKALPDVKIRLFIVNDGSQRLDENHSAGVIQEVIPDLQWISYKENRGKGYALRQGVKNSTADFIVYTSRLLRNFNAKLLRLKVDDTQAGLKGFRKNIKDIFLSTTIDRYLFDLEFIYLISAKKEIKVVGYPIALRPGITFSKMNRKILFQEARNFLKIWVCS